MSDANKNKNEEKKVQSKGLVFSHDNDQLIVCHQEKKKRINNKRDVHNQ